MKNEKEFDMKKKAIKPRFYLLPLQWIISLYFKIIGKIKLKKTNFKSYKEPSLILCNHASMIDFPNVVLSMFPHRMCWVASIEEFNGREWLFRHLGVIPKRKFTSDLLLVKKIVHMINKQKISVVIYPEARFSLAGVNEYIGDGLGKMAKLCKCRVIMIKSKGNYLFSPQWNKHPYRKNKVEVEATEIFSAKDAQTLSAEELQKKIEDAFEYDDYQWALDEKVAIKYKKRAENIHRILYKCANCGEEGFMKSKGIHLWCEKCHSKWEMDEYSTLHCLTGENRFSLPSKWYLWEKEETIKEVNEGRYHFEDDVKIEKLVNSKIKFVPIGTIHMVHDLNGYTLKGTLDDGSTFELHKPPFSTRSMHIEYDFKGRGDALDFATLEHTWWVYPIHNVCLTKFNFATEAIYLKNEKDNQNKI